MDGTVTISLKDYTELIAKAESLRKIVLEEYISVRINRSEWVASAGEYLYLLKKDAAMKDIATVITNKDNEITRLKRRIEELEMADTIKKNKWGRFGL